MGGADVSYRPSIVERLAVLEATCERQAKTIEALNRDVERLCENAANRHDVQRRLVAIAHAITSLAGATGRPRSWFEGLFP